MPEIAFTLPFATQSLNTRQRKHWAQLSREQHQMSQEIMAAIGGPRYFPRPPWERVKVTVVRCSAGRLDPDGLYGSVKPLLDALCVSSRRHPSGLSIIQDDNADLLTLEVKQSPAAPGAGSTVVRIEQLA